MWEQILIPTVTRKPQNWRWIHVRMCRIMIGCINSTSSSKYWNTFSLSLGAISNKKLFFFWVIQLPRICGNEFWSSQWPENGKTGGEFMLEWMGNKNGISEKKFVNTKAAWVNKFLKFVEIYDTYRLPEEIFIEKKNFF